MSPLYLYNGNLLLNNGRLATSADCCCQIEVVIYICSNEPVTDDYFDVRLNGKLIGQYRPTQPGTAMLFVTDMDITQDLMCNLDWPAVDPNNPCQCSGTTLLDKIQIQKEDFVAGLNNKITLTVIENNSVNNGGQLWVLSIDKKSNKVIDNLFYGKWFNNQSGDVVFANSLFYNPWGQ